MDCTFSTYMGPKICPRSISAKLENFWKFFTLFLKGDVEITPQHHLTLVDSRCLYLPLGTRLIDYLLIPQAYL